MFSRLSNGIRVNSLSLSMLNNRALLNKTADKMIAFEID
jgi:hypothetical protein